MKESMTQFIMKHFITLYYFIDIIVNFNTGFYEKNDLVIDRKLIALRYFKVWFWIDLVATIPFEQIIGLFSPSGVNAQNNYIQLLRFLKFFRLLR